ncbi:MAG: hypothetical protein J5I50_00860 [Chitinophagaceae bacterium]|nr:hypothetical protein [Chitinophagaceae bacterium]
MKTSFVTKKWIEIALINFCVVALAGVVLRYKMNFSLPSINHKYMLYGHSNFAFVGWASLALMTLMVRYLVRNKLETNYLKYKVLLIIETLSAYGMFISFIIQGYDFFSNLFSILAILVSYIFIYTYWKDINKVKDTSYAKLWFKGGMVLWAVSSLGAIFLAYLLANNIRIQDLYIAAMYFFLHFQYNGWFLFICFGIFFAYLERIGLTQARAASKNLFLIMICTVLPAYFLSILWLKLPWYLYWTANVAGVLQLLVFIFFIQILRTVVKNSHNRFHSSTYWLWTMAGIAFTLKIILQLLSIIPSLSQFAFGYRPIIIGYLHLSFVGVVSLFIFGYINEFIHRFRGRVSGIGALVFVVGFIFQELILMFQGLEAMNVQPVKSANIMLFYCVILQAAGLIWITIGIMKASDNEESLIGDGTK